VEASRGNALENIDEEYSCNLYKRIEIENESLRYPIHRSNPYISHPVPKVLMVFHGEVLMRMGNPITLAKYFCLGLIGPMKPTVFPGPA
jgi:hypothetical protein